MLPRPGCLQTGTGGRPRHTPGGELCVRAGVSWGPRLLPFHFPRAWPGCSGLRCPGAPGAVKGHSTDGRAGARAPGRCFSAGLLSPPCAFWLQFCEPQLRGCRRLLASGARLTRWRFVDVATAQSAPGGAGSAAGREETLPPGTSSATSDGALRGQALGQTARSTAVAPCAVSAAPLLATSVGSGF